MPDYFAQHSGALNLSAQTTTPNRGFRPGQLGALHAVLAHASVHDDPAIVCLPTGYRDSAAARRCPPGRLDGIWHQLRTARWCGNGLLARERVGPGSDMQGERPLRLLTMVCPKLRP